MLFLSKSSVSVSFVPSRVSEPLAPISICGKVSGLGIRCLGLHRFSELSGLGCISSLSGLASLVCGYLKLAWPEICGPIFGRCLVTIGRKPIWIDVARLAVPIAPKLSPADKF
jgi:hypothetical protein